LAVIALGLVATFNLLRINQTSPSAMEVAND
jgi:hypothetical protein